MNSPADAAPVLVIGIGNLSRGDDALGLLLVERLEAWLAAEGITSVEVITDVQLHPEHVVDIADRPRVLIVDAGAAAGGTEPYEHGSVQEAPDWSFTTHAVSPGALVAMARAVGLHAPTAVELLVVQGQDYALGAGLSPVGAQNLEAAWIFLREWCLEASREAAAG